jgi:hypothetical protein
MEKKRHNDKKLKYIYRTRHKLEIDELNNSFDCRGIILFNTMQKLII